MKKSSELPLAADHAAGLPGESAADMASLDWRAIAGQRLQQAIAFEQELAQTGRRLDVLQREHLELVAVAEARLQETLALDRQHRALEAQWRDAQERLEQQWRAAQEQLEHEWRGTQERLEQAWRGTQAQLEHQLREAHGQYQAILRSRSWRITRPLRVLVRGLSALVRRTPR